MNSLEQSSKKILIAFCGKSASGKDTIARTVAHEYPANFLTSYTTRPRRTDEIANVHYYFVRHNTFLANRPYLDETCFRGWYYGHHEKDIKNGINVGIFDTEGIYKIVMNNNRNKLFDRIIIIELEAPLPIRLWRSIKREHCFKFEFLRRAWQDWKDFKNFSFDLTLNCTQPGVYYKKIKNDSVTTFTGAFDLTLNKIYDIIDNYVSDY